MKKRIIPLICLIVIAAAVIAGIVYLPDKQGAPVQEPVVYQPYQLKNIASEINTTIWAVQNGKTTEDEVLYKCENKAVLVDFQHCLAKKNHIDVFLRDPTDEKIEIFNKLFPYNCFEFHDANKGVAVLT